MSTLSEIRDCIESISHQNSEQRSIYHLGVVKDVDSSGEFCTVDVYDAEWTNVRLNAVQNGKCTFKVFPKVGSYVMVADLSNGNMSDLGVFMFSEYDKVEIGTAEHTTANADVLKTELQKLSDRVDLLYKAITTAATGQQDGGSTYKSNMGLILKTATSESWDDIEDKTIKHGA